MLPNAMPMPAPRPRSARRKITIGLVVLLGIVGIPTPVGHYFMLGDNRDNSTDSRVLGQVGYVPFDHLVGRVATVMFSLDGTSLRFDRMSVPVR